MMVILIMIIMIIDIISISITSTIASIMTTLLLVLLLVLVLVLVLHYYGLQSGPLGRPRLGFEFQAGPLRKTAPRESLGVQVQYSIVV